MSVTRHPARGAAPFWCDADAGYWTQLRDVLHDPVAAAHREIRCAAHGMTGIRVSRILCWFVSALVASTGVANAAVKGTFIGSGTYATAEGCIKFAIIEAGGDKNVGTVPETLTQDGFSTWEGGCTFTSITEKAKGHSWAASMDCSEEAEEGAETDLFERLADGKIKVTTMGNSTILQRCDAERGK